MTFHARHKLQMLAHDPARYRSAGRVVAAAGTAPREQTAVTYRDLFLAAMASPPPAAATPTRCSMPTAGSARTSTGRGATTWWPGSTPAGAARSR